MALYTEGSVERNVGIGVEVSRNETQTFFWSHFGESWWGSSAKESAGASEGEVRGCERRQGGRMMSLIGSERVLRACLIACAPDALDGVTAVEWEEEAAMEVLLAGS